MVEIVFSLLLRTIIYFHVYIILEFPITYRNASVFFSMRMRMSTSNSNHDSTENTYPKGRALMQMYRVVPITKRGN